MKIENSILERVDNVDIVGGIFNIPSSVTEISDCAFYGCTDLTSIVIPSSVKSIGYWAFLNCTGLTSIVLPVSITSINYYAFYGCTGLMLHNVYKSKIIDLAISLLPSHNGLCSCLDKATRIMSMQLHTAISVQSTFPNFKQEIAIEKFGGCDEVYWWPIEDKTSRLSFLEWLRNN